MTLRSDRARRRAVRLRNIRLLLIGILILIIAALVYFFVIVPGNSPDQGNGIPSPIFFASTFPSREMPSIMRSGVIIEKLIRIVL